MGDDNHANVSANSFKTAGSPYVRHETIATNFVQATRSSVTVAYELQNKAEAFLRAVNNAYEAAENLTYWAKLAELLVHSESDVAACDGAMLATEQEFETIAPQQLAVYVELENFISHVLEANGV